MQVLSTRLERGPHSHSIPPFGWRDGDHASLFDWQRFTLLAALRPGTFYRGWEHVPQEVERIGPRRGLGSTEEGGEELSQRSCHQPSVDGPDKAGMFSVWDCASALR
jgi:hypothetical protein